MSFCGGNTRRQAHQGAARLGCDAMCGVATSERGGDSATPHPVTEHFDRRSRGEGQIVHANLRRDSKTADLRARVRVGRFGCQFMCCRRAKHCRSIGFLISARRHGKRTTSISTWFQCMRRMNSRELRVSSAGGAPAQHSEHLSADQQMWNKLLQEEGTRDPRDRTAGCAHGQSTPR